MGEELERAEVEALLRARQELGAEYDAELVQSFADRIERTVESRLAERKSTTRAARKAEEGAGSRQMILGFVSLGTGIPITAIAGEAAGLPGILAAWLGIVGVNGAHALQSRRG